MSSSMNTILIIGGTSGIGESFARRWHRMGKRIIITGRRKDRLAAIKDSLPGSDIHGMDNADLAAVPGHIDKLFSAYPNIDTVWVNSGVHHTSSIQDASTSSDADVVDEVTVNITAPMIIARHVIPRLLAQKTETAFMAAMHSYLVGIRQSLQGTNVNVIDIVAPAVKTDLLHMEVMAKLPMMELEDFTDEIFDVLDKNEAKSLKEVAAGTAIGRVQAWRSSIGAILEERKLGG